MVDFVIRTKGGKSVVLFNFLVMSGKSVSLTLSGANKFCLVIFSTSRMAKLLLMHVNQIKRYHNLYNYGWKIIGSDRAVGRIEVRLQIMKLREGVVRIGN